MASVSHRALVAAVEWAVASSGHTVTLISSDRDQPAKFLVSGPTLGSLSIWVYIKNLTPADRSDPDEYRIQLRSEILPLDFNPGGPTVLLGYHAGSELFVGFDARTVSTGARTQLSGGYVSLRTVMRAKRRGMTFDRDRRNRIAVGLRPEMLMPYCLHASEIHWAADEGEVAAILSKTAAVFSATDGVAFEEDELNAIPAERQRLLRSVYVLAREAGFRRRVLEAYGMRCAVSGMQLGIVEAAHILPVRVTGSTDRVDNGLSLLPQYHRAYDSGLIYLSPDYMMRFNEARADRLQVQGLGNGLNELRQSLGRIRLPRSKRYWPNPELIEQGNNARGIGLAAAR